MQGSSFGFVKIFNEHIKEDKEKNNLADFLLISLLTFIIFLIISVLFIIAKVFFNLN